MKASRRLAVAASRLVPKKWHFHLFSLPVDILHGPLTGLIDGYSSMVGSAGTLHSIPKGIAWTRGAHFDAKGRLLFDLSPGLNRDMASWLLERGCLLPGIKHLRYDVVSLLADGHSNYFHWLFGVLPLLEVLDPDTIARKRFLACCDNQFQKQTLALFGIPNSAVIPARRRTFYSAPLLHVPTTHTGPVAPTLESLIFLNQHLVKNPSRPLPPPPAGPRFYISRRLASSRKLVNESVLLDLLEPYGFKHVTMETLTVAQQISLFHNAEIILSPTGAALANLAFCRPGTSVLILMPKGCDDFLYRDLAETAGLNSHLQWLEPATGAESDPVKSDLMLTPGDLDSIRTNLHALGLKA